MGAGPLRRRKLETKLQDLVAEVLGTEASTVPTATPLAQLGMESKQILALHAAVEQEFELSLSPTLGWQFPTITALAAHLDESFDGSAAEPEAPQTAADSGQADFSAEALEDMSDDEFDAFLADLRTGGSES